MTLLDQVDSAEDRFIKGFIVLQHSVALLVYIVQSGHVGSRSLVVQNVFGRPVQELCIVVTRAVIRIIQFIPGVKLLDPARQTLRGPPIGYPLN